MEEKNNENKNSNFKAVQNPENYKTTSNLKNKSGFGKTVVLPFISGVLGCAAVVGVCFGIPDVKYKLIGTNSSNFSVAPSNSTSSDGTVSQVK